MGVKIKALLRLSFTVSSLNNHKGLHVREQAQIINAHCASCHALCYVVTSSYLRSHYTMTTSPRSLNIL